MRHVHLRHVHLRHTLLESLADALSDAHSVHAGLQVIGGDLGRGYHVAVLAVEGSLDTAVEEEGHVGVLLGLGGVELRQEEENEREVKQGK